MKKIIIIFMLVFVVGLYGCAKTIEGNTFKFETRGFDLLIGEERKINLVVGRQDLSDDIVFKVLTLDGLDGSSLLQLTGTKTTVNQLDTISASVASVSLKGLDAGSVRITAYLKNSPNVFDSVIINVNQVNMGGMKLNSSVDYCYLNETISFTVSTFPAGLYDGFILSTSNEDILKVTSSNTLTGVSVGECIVYATSVYDSNVVASKTIKVIYREVTSITVPESNITLVKGDLYPIEATAKPGNASQIFTYATTNSNVCGFQETGVIRAVNPGTCIITIFSDTKKVSAIINVTVVYAEDESVSVKESEYSVKLNLDLKVKPDILPAGASPVVTAVVTSGEEFISVSVNSSNEVVVRGLSIGEGEVEITTVGGHKTSFKVTVIYQDVTKVTINSDATSIKVSESTQLEWTVTPEFALQDVIFESSDESIATVSETGLVTGLKEGVVEITVYDQAKKRSAKIEITIIASN